MSDKDYINGAYKELASLHEERLTDLKTAVTDGLKSITDELKKSREQGHIPVPVVLVLVKAISWPYILVIIYLTGAANMPALIQWLTGQ